MQITRVCRWTYWIASRIRGCRTHFEVGRGESHVRRPRPQLDTEHRPRAVGDAAERLDALVATLGLDPYTCPVENLAAVVARDRGGSGRQASHEGGRSSDCGQSLGKKVPSILGARLGGGALGIRGRLTGCHRCLLASRVARRIAGTRAGTGTRTTARTRWIVPGASRKRDKEEASCKEGSQELATRRKQGRHGKSPPNLMSVK